MSNHSESLGGYATRGSFDKGDNVPLKIARNVAASSTAVDIRVYRMGWYGGLGGRLVHTRLGATVNNTLACNAMDPTTGKLDCGNWSTTYTIPAASLPASGVYLVKLTATDGSHPENRIVFVVRDDDRQPESKLLYILPTATYLAYNNFGGKSLYFDTNGGGNTVAGTPRAVKVSFNRPLDKAEADRDRFVGPDFHLLSWLERQGYDVSYTDDYQAHLDGAELRQHKVIVIPGHSEYWSLEEFNNVKAARDAGVNIASFSANTAYWKVRYEDGGRTLVCYKTVQGDGSGGSGAVSANDWGPDGLLGTADDALGADGRALTSDDHPENSTTTFRDNGAPQGDPNAPPGGRVGPNLPENSLFGLMYVGDNDSQNFPLTVPAANANAEFAADRIWRNTGIPTNTTTQIGTGLVGWEWDAVPTQAQYLAQQPAGVKRLTNTNVQTASDNSWLLDEGRQRATVPPSGQPGTVNAVKYTAPSGAIVFSSGTILWASGLANEEDLRIKQATYNTLSDMGVQPGSPEEITLDPVGSNLAPSAAFTVTPDHAHLNQVVTFNGAASLDPDGVVTKYQWDLNGDGVFELDSGTNSLVTRSYISEGTFDVRLRVTDNGGATDLTVRTLTVIGNDPPVASFNSTPNPSVVGQVVQFNGTASTDSDGNIVRYEWDLDGNGTFETNSGTSATTSRSYATAGSVAVSLRVTDNGGKSSVATAAQTVNVGGVSSYGDAVLDTPGLLHYWRLGETSGASFADSKGTTPATASGGVALGVTGGVAGDPNKAARFDGVNGTARTRIDLSSASAITVEFWLNWEFYTDNDRLALEFTDNFNNSDGGFLVDPDAPQAGGAFAVAIGRGAARNNVFFARPTAAAWHHYAFVLDPTAPAASQITPYVDGRLVTYTKTESGTGAGTFADAFINFMSRGGSGLFGRGDLDEVAIYSRALGASTIAEHYASFGTNRRPVARFTMSPNPTRIGVPVTFNASSSSDPDGQLVRYEWDLDGNGSYEVSTTSPTTTRTYTSEGDIQVSLRVNDNLTGTDTETHLLRIGNQPPTASFTANPNPALVDLPVNFDAASSADSDGTIAKYEWDLDGDGTFETDAGTTRTTSRTYTAPGSIAVRLRVTDDGGKTAVATVPVTVGTGGVSNYGDTILDTPGLVGYWRLGEPSGTTIADSKGTNHGNLAGGPARGVQGAVGNDPNTATRFDGVDDSGRVPLNISGTSAITVEFWLKWTRYTPDDHLAMEFTDNFNGADGGFIVDPDAPQQGGTFGVGLGRFETRNNVFFARPSAGQWHHYAFVMNTAAPAAQQILPYVDGQPVSFAKLDSGTGGGPFANAFLNLMSRGGASLFGGGDLDEVAVYNRALSASTVAEHYAASGTNSRPSASFTISPNPVKVGRTVTFDASASTDSDGTVSTYQWDLDGNGSFETAGTTATVTKTYAAEATIDVQLRVIDNQGGTDVEQKSLVVGNAPPVASFTVTPSMALVGQTVAFDASASADADGTIAKYEWDLDGDGTFETDTGTTRSTSRSYSTPQTITVGLRVTDDDGKIGSASRTVNVRAGTYADAVLATPGLIGYWRLNEATGPTFADSRGSSTATTGGGVVFGVPGALSGDPGAAARFDGVDDFAQAALNLSTTSAVTVEFWLKWSAYADNDALALEFTSNFNANSGGFLVDPNSSTGTFAVGLGSDSSRYAVQFARPSAGQWHHYAFVLDATAAPTSQITPYVDGLAVSFSVLAAGTGAGPFANSILYFMSRGGAGLFGAGDLDELAVYDRALPASTIAGHHSNGLP